MAGRTVPYAPAGTATGGSDEQVPSFGQNRMNQFRNRTRTPPDRG
jgi:hypothetical protein